MKILLIKMKLSRKLQWLYHAFLPKKHIFENNNKKLLDRLEIPTWTPNIVFMASKKLNILFFLGLTFSFM